MWKSVNMFNYFKKENNKINEIMKNKKRVILVGNPNVGKSTLFNALTGLRQHTGNWAGKTVEKSSGKFDYDKTCFEVIDLPGTYSIDIHSFEESITREVILENDYELCIIVCDATCFKRNLNLIMQILEITNKVIICINLIDEANKKGIEINCKNLSDMLQVSVLSTCARNKKDILQLKKMIKEEMINKKDNHFNIQNNFDNICDNCISYYKKDYDEKERKWDQLVTSKIFGTTIMLILLFIIFWITIIGSNIPSKILSDFFSYIGLYIKHGFKLLGFSTFLTGLLYDGIYCTLSNVIAVMLPPMAIFFPMFTLLEDFGYLPRVAFQLDHVFEKVNACGKQSLTMCMSFGCNCVGICGSRIIDGKRERLLSILTNNFIPCNGRFPLLVILITLFYSGNGFIQALYLLFIILLGISTSFLSTYILSKTILKGKNTSFTLELPPYRKPQIKKAIIRSMIDRCFYVLGRAIIVSIPAGAFIFLLANISMNDMSILLWLSNYLDPIGNLIGMDGVIILAFILGFPANEIVLPIMLMIYLSSNTLVDISSISNINDLLIMNGWTQVTALCVMIFSIMHFPCASALMCIKREVKEWKWVILAFVLPTMCGFITCFLINAFFG